MKTTIVAVLAGALACVSANAQPYAYVATRVGTSSSIRVISTRTNTIVNTIGLPSVQNVNWVVITPDGLLGFSGGTNAFVAVFQSAVLRYIVIPGGSTGADATPDSTRLYVVNSGRLVTVISTEMSTVLTSIDLGGNPGARYIAISADGTRAYVTDRTGFFIIDTDPKSATYNTVLAYIVTDGEPTGIALTFDGLKAYLTTGRGVLAADLVTFVVSTLTPIATQGVVISPDGRYVYAAGTDPNWDIVIIDAATDQNVANAGPQNVTGLAFHPDGDRFYALSRRTCPTAAGIVYPIYYLDNSRQNPIVVNSAIFTAITVDRNY